MESLPQRPGLPSRSSEEGFLFSSIPMTFRQRLLAVLQGQRPDVMPWFADLTYWTHAQRLAGALPPDYEGDEGFVKLHADYHVGYYLGYASVWSDTHENVEFSSEREGDRITLHWQTPVGEL